MSTLPEPQDRTIVAWFDNNSELYAVYHRSDLNGEGDERWFTADQHNTIGEAPLTWKQLLDEMRGSRGPSELVSNGRIRRAA